MKQKGLSIHPLDLGTLVDMEMSSFTLRRNQGVKMDAPCIGWLITGGDKIILVDSGPCDPEWAIKYHRPISRTPSQQISNALAGIGYSPNDVETVLFTHLHYDHCFNLEHFSRAQFIVQKAELQYAVAPLQEDAGTYEVGIPGVLPSWMRYFSQFAPVDGDQEIIPGINVVHLPGHTHGSQCVVVDSMSGRWIIAGDNVALYDNWYGETNKKIFSGVYQNLFEYERSMTKLEQLGGRILPSHDPKIFDCKIYE
jgi:glyoxylase-like metal-dependent hydrolase (beta-lactamase superfamily II)